MKIFWGYDHKEVSIHTIVIGNFDGFHLGHVELLMAAADQKKENENLGVATFYPHPDTVVRARSDNFALSTLDEKIEEFEKRGIDSVFFVEFTAHLSQLSPSAFIQRLLEMVNVSRIVVGENFRFGKAGKGTPQTLKMELRQKGIDVITVPLLKVEGTPISSTLIRNCIYDGHFLEAEKYLGRQYLISGTVMHGKGIGHKIGFPTANLDVQGKLLPRQGVYSGESFYSGQSYFSLFFIGKPTLSFSEEEVLEVWMEDFDDDIYGEALEVHISKFLRPTKKIDDLSELKLMITEDLKKAKNGI